MKIDLNGKKVLVTGAAGFIGYHLCLKLLEQFSGLKIVGIDSLTDYYDVSLKDARLKMLGEVAKTTPNGSTFEFLKMDLADKGAIDELFGKSGFEVVVNLAAQAGVRYSIDNPAAYIQSNIVGFFNILEAVRHNSVLHLVYASSSSVYGGNKKVPFCESDKVDNPVSLYAATKKSDELLAAAYSSLYGIKATGLRFFTVYGPYGRPDMAYFKFTDRIVKGLSIDVYNNGDLYRDFTYIDDIVKGVIAVMQSAPEGDNGGAIHKVYNIGNNHCESLMHFINVLEDCLMKEKIISERAKKNFLPMQSGDVYQTYADISALKKDFGFAPSTSIEEGLAKFAAWYKKYYTK